MDIKTFIEQFTDAVMTYLFHADPFNISSLADDEYATEAKMIVDRIVHPGVDREDLGELSFVIRDVFRRMFNEEYSSTISVWRYAHFAADIWALYDALHAEHKITLPLEDELGNDTNQSLTS